MVFAATGETSSINVDNTSTASGAASVYDMTPTGRTLVKATPAGLR